MLVLEVIKNNSKKPELYEPDATENNFQKYVDQHGEERAKGYLQAMLDFQEQMDIILFENHGNGYGCPHSHARVTRSMWLVFEAQKRFFENPLATQLLKNIGYTPK